VKTLTTWDAVQQAAFQALQRGPLLERPAPGALEADRGDGVLKHHGSLRGHEVSDSSAEQHELLRAVAASIRAPQRCALRGDLSDGPDHEAQALRADRSYVSRGGGGKLVTGAGH
jgi:hypothetical protein